jgi:heat shock protein HslJ
LRGWVAIITLLAVGLAAGCGGGGESPQLEGTFWVLTDARDVTLPPGVVPTASFSEGMVRGSTGCNQYTASYVADGESLEIGAVASTRMACPPPRDAVEQEYVTALGLVASWAASGNQLLLSDAAGDEILRYGGARTGGDS